MFNTHAAEQFQICQGFLPVAMNTALNTADVVSLKGYNSCLIVFYKAVGTPGDDPVITLLQGTDVAFATNKALNITRIDKKQAATNLLAVGTYTKSTAADNVTATSHDTFSTNTWTNSDLAEQAAIVLIDVKATDLDVANGYDCIRASVADVGTNAQLGSMLYILYDPKNMKETLESAIVD
jgi:hypothetical protein